MQNKPEQDRNQEATVYLVSDIDIAVEHELMDQGNLDERVTDALMWELML